MSGRTPNNIFNITLHPKFTGDAGPLSSIVEDNEEWMSLDDYVAPASGRERLLYARVSGNLANDLGIKAGDLIVVDRARQPTSTDLVFGRNATGYSIKDFTKAGSFLNPLRIVSRPVKSTESFQVIGVITHFLRKVGGAK